MPLNIYLLTRTDKWSYDHFDAMVVIADDVKSAKKMAEMEAGYGGGWPDADKVKSKLVGVASKNAKASVVLASFNAG